MHKDNGIFDQVKAKIKSNPAILLSLFPGSKQRGNEIYFDAPSYNSWSYNVQKHIVKDFRDETGGDIIDAYGKYNGLSDSYEAAKKLANQLNIVHEARQKIQMPNERTKKIIDEIWNGSVPLSDGDTSPAGLYLSETRGLSTDTLGKLTSLRYHPELYKANSTEQHPALVCGLFSPSGQLAGIQRTYLEFNPYESWQKISKQHGEAKMCLGVIRGNYVELGRRGSSDKIVICEGVESGLALRDSIFRYTMVGAKIWCSLSAGNMVNLAERIPVYDGSIKEIDIRPDIDLNKVGINAAMTLARRLAEKGHNVKINYPKIVDTPK